ncbi:hypothetical protein SAMN05920897_12117 [Alkalispirochaeta americana]|uniref:Uncharacterized protein n=1 Tax=Alkalispirochaeta americana TaxID=159291 RepID=A0A1N6X8F4_9SPIO|nr:hypothetical protein [Alkalispirochaeta americana]SIQ98634.1 hypothetical protein SAMN05920897_12117 [Alkalispirochaeta americana]
MIEKIEPFRRANFFNGLLATPQFWNGIQEYGHRKELYYNKLFHGTGIIPGVMDEFRVRSVQGGGGIFMLVVNPGAVLDEKGRSVMLHETQALTLDSRKFTLPCTVYITVRYHEVLDDYYQNEENSEYQGYRKKMESAKVEVLPSIPPGGDHVEIARIFLEEDKQGEIRKISEGGDFTAPGPNTLDYRYVPWVCPAKKGLHPHLREHLVNLFEQTRNVAMVIHDTVELPGLREIQTVALTGKMLIQCGDVSFDDVIHTIYPLFDLNNQIAQELLEYERQKNERYFSAKSEFEIYRQAIFSMGDYVKTYDGRYETLDGALKQQQIIIDTMKALFVTRKVSLHDIALISHDFPRILVLDNERYTLVDVLDLRDDENKERHKLSFPATKDVSVTSLALTYPDGQMVRDNVIRYVAGSAKMTLRNIVKNRKLLLVRRTDVVSGNYTIQTVLNGTFERRIVVDAPDTENRWRNLSASFDEDMVTNYTPTIEFRLGEKGRDNFGRIWVYQKL